ncbi:cytochrome P450 6A1 [Culex quinquefasciatus]|uniref:Cytochrome P450 6A1 n=1 Tax=Culex quinquefasciatus TaxID=7176 RepID=B0WG90_CULQU|nr:cytochrome P450 6A1 [Culex quinquefasciatus]|eukprot:XP_001847724.1 cytochrome P450 6A1 [Culex quinquefasciatus]
MFCPSNETLQNITEKTKLLAQKCTQQIRVSSDQQTSGSGGATEGGQQDSTGKVPPSPAKESGGSKSLRCLCPCKGTLSKIIAKKVGAVTGKEQPRSTTRWYVKSSRYQSKQFAVQVQPKIMLLYLTILALGLVVLWIRKRYSYWSDRGVIYLKPHFPSGNLQGVGRKQHRDQVIRRCYQQLKGSGPFGGIFFFTSPVALALDLDLVKSVLVKDFQHFHDRSVYYNERDDPLSAHLFTMEGNKWRNLRAKLTPTFTSGTKWRNLRAKLTPTFTSGKMKMMFPTILGVADQFRQLLLKEASGGGEVEMKEILSRFTTDVIGSCAFGLECNSLHDSEAVFRRMGRKVFELPPGRIVMATLAQQFRSIARALRITIIDPDVSQFFMNVVRETVEYREKNRVERNDFMNLLIKLKNGQPVEDGLTLEEIAAQAFVFFLAGFETSSTAMSHCLYELAQNPELQEKARADVRETIKKHGSLSYEAAQDMQYIGNCINESLRKYPPVGQLTRAVSKDYKVPGTDKILAKGATLRSGSVPSGAGREAESVLLFTVWRGSS